MSLARVTLPLALLAGVAMMVGFSGCGGGSPSGDTTSVSPDTAGWPTLPTEVDLSTLRYSSLPVGGCSYSFDDEVKKTLDISGCEEGQEGTVTVDAPRQEPTCLESGSETRCSASNGVAVETRASSFESASELLKGVIEDIKMVAPDAGDNASGGPEGAVTWKLQMRTPEGFLFKGVVSLGSPQQLSGAEIAPCTAPETSAAISGTVTVTNDTSGFSAEPGIHLNLIEDGSPEALALTAVGDCHHEDTSIYAAEPVQPEGSFDQRIVLIVPRYFSPARPDGDPAALAGLAIEPRLYNAEGEAEVAGETAVFDQEGRRSKTIPLSAVVE